ncbi:MAG: MerR family transcriptional regulator [Candidatus Accumulibacter sp.]|jgi:DNA-binding transcriptional MerR regulator|nr:MerR family transcriptional regulator [Accumulibacter sp.]
MEARLDKPPEDVNLPPIPAKRYFTIGEVSKLCDVETYVIRYWEGHFSQLKPVKRRGNRRYYQHHEIILIRRIRELLRVEGFTLSGAVRRLDELTGKQAATRASKSLREELTSVIEMLRV